MILSPDVCPLIPDIEAVASSGNGPGTWSPLHPVAPGVTARRTGQARAAAIPTLTRSSTR